MTSTQSAHKKPFFSRDERARIERNGAEFNQPAVNEVADFDRSDWRLRDISDDASVNFLLCKPIFVNEDRAAVAVDLARSVAQAHTDRDALAIANIRAPIGLPADTARSAPIDTTEYR